MLLCAVGTAGQRTYQDAVKVEQVLYCVTPPSCDYPNLRNMHNAVRFFFWNFVRWYVHMLFNTCFCLQYCISFFSDILVSLIMFVLCIPGVHVDGTIHMESTTDFHYQITLYFRHPGVNRKTGPAFKVYTKFTAKGCDMRFVPFTLLHLLPPITNPLPYYTRTRTHAGKYLCFHVLTTSSLIQKFRNGDWCIVASAEPKLWCRCKSADPCWLPNVYWPNSFEKSLCVVTTTNR